LDTRDKIIHLRAGEVPDLARRRGRKLKVVVAHFDPLHAAHVRRLNELADGSCLVIALTDPPSPILSQHARAELAAGLAMVDYVVIPEGMEAAAVLPQLSPDSIFWEEAADQVRFSELMAHVHARQRSSPVGE